jgi:hypothetical protein
MAKSAYFQFRLSAHGMGAANLHADFTRVIESLNLAPPKPFSSAYSYQSARAKPALTIDLRVPTRQVNPDSPVNEQEVALVNIDRFGKVPTEEAIYISDLVLSRFDVHVGFLRLCGFIEAVNDSLRESGKLSIYAACAPAVLPALSWTSPDLPRPFLIDLEPWTYISAKFYPTVHEALLRGNYPEISPAPKGVWVKTGDWTMDGATNLVRMKAFWGAFWQQSGLDPARVPGAMGEGLPG